MTNELVKVNFNEMRAQLHRMQPEFQAVLPPGITPERFARTAVTAIQNNPDLLKCSQRSLFSACMKAAQDGLLPDGREGALVIFKGNAQWMPMVYGMRKKILESGEIRDLRVECVYEGDEFHYQLGDDPKLIHNPSLDPDVLKLGRRRAITFVYSIAVFKDGYLSRDVMSIAEIEQIRDRYSRSSDKGPWHDPIAFSEMAKKTVVRRHTKSLPTGDGFDRVVGSFDAFHTVADSGAQQPDNRTLPSAQRLPQPTVASRLDDFAALASNVAGNQERGSSVESVGEPRQLPPPAIDIDSGEVIDQETGEIVDHEAQEAAEDKKADANRRAGLQSGEQRIDGGSESPTSAQAHYEEVKKRWEPIGPTADMYIEFSLNEIKLIVENPNQMDAYYHHKAFSKWWNETKDHRGNCGVPVATAAKLASEMRKIKERIEPKLTGPGSG